MKFIVTRELGKLARWLRILGFDTLYFREDNVGELALRALREKRAILTRAREVKRLRKSTAVIFSQKINQQIKELKEKGLIKIDKSRIFTRCTLCNRLLRKEKKEAAQDAPPYVYKTQTEFMRCPDCGHLYWRGTHWGNIKEVIELSGL